MVPIVDYASTGLNISEAMIDMAKKYPDKASRPDYVLWNNLQVETADWWDVPTRGIIRIEILSVNSDAEQGIDIKIESGALQLGGRRANFTFANMGGQPL